MELNIIIPSEVRKRKTNITRFRLYVESEKKKIQMNLFSKQRLTDIENNLTVTKEERDGAEGRMI